MEWKNIIPSSLIKKNLLWSMQAPFAAILLYWSFFACNDVLKGTLQRNKSKAIDMQFFWLIDRAKRGQFTIYYWAQGETNLAHFFTKHHLGSHHRRVRPIHNNITLINKFARVYLIPGLHKWRSWPTQIQTNNSRLPATSWANAHI